MAETKQAPAEQAAAGGEIEHGAYEVLKARLNEHAASLKTQTESLNKARAELFGGQEISVIGNERIRTEFECRPKDIVAVDGLLLFGFNVKLNMKTAGLRDLFALHRLEEGEVTGTTASLADDLPLFSAKVSREPAKPAERDELRDALSDLNPDEMTPREALEALYRLKAASK